MVETAVAATIQQSGQVPIASTKKDTIPAEVKRHFFQGVQPPNLLTDYDVIGFDADHCMVKYNNKALIPFLIQIGLQELVDMGYPKSLADFDYNEESREMEICLNASVFDIDKGLIIKLAEGLEVVQAMKGMRKLTKEEIKAAYGSPPIFTSYQWPNTTHLARDKGAYWVFLTFFDTSKVVVVLRAIELMEKGLLPGKTYFDIAIDLRTMVYNIFLHYNDRDVFPISSFGSYFKEIVDYPAKYIQYQPELRDSLTRLKKAGKKLFLGTNSHTEYSNLIMTATLGDDWRSFFDVVCCYCCKPLFFWDQKPSPFYTYDSSTRTLKGKAINDPDQMPDTPGLIYTEGNSKILTHYFQRIMKIDRELRVAFFGDHYINDVHGSSSNPGWDGFAVVEELSRYDSTLEGDQDAELIKYDKYWGEDTYFVEKSEDGKRLKRSYFISQLEDCARYMLPFVRNIDLWMGDNQQ